MILHYFVHLSLSIQLEKFISISKSLLKCAIEFYQPDHLNLKHNILMVFESYIVTKIAAIKHCTLAKKKEEWCTFKGIFFIEDGNREREIKDEWRRSFRINSIGIRKIKLSQNAISRANDIECHSKKRKELLKKPQERDTSVHNLWSLWSKRLFLNTKQFDSILLKDFTHDVKKKKSLLTSANVVTKYHFSVIIDY